MQSRTFQLFLQCEFKFMLPGLKMAAGRSGIMKNISGFVLEGALPSQMPRDLNANIRPCVPPMKMYIPKRYG